MQKMVLYIGALLALILVAIGAYLFKKISHLKLKLKLKKRFTHARAKEQSAEDLLKKEGFTIEISQKGFKLPMWVNGQAMQYLVRPDAFASKEGKRYLVEIKTGLVAIDPKHSATRRQLLEYFHGFAVDGVLLVDAELGEIHNVYFQRREKKEEMPSSNKENLKLIVAFLIGMLFSSLLTLLFLRGYL